MSLVKHYPTDIISMFRDFNQNHYSSRDGTFRVPIDLMENEDEYVVELDLPGFEKQDISITIEQNVLSIQAEREQNYETEESSYEVIHQERFASKFSRKLKLRQTINAKDAKVEYENGVLRVTAPKAEESKPVKLTL